MLLATTTRPKNLLEIMSKLPLDFVPIIHYHISVNITLIAKAMAKRAHMDLTLPNLLHLLRSATGPADVFGALVGDPQAALKRRYRELVTIAHPDRNQGSVDAANEACIALQEWYAAAQRQIAQGVYGVAPRISATTKLHQYHRLRAAAARRPVRAVPGRGRRRAGAAEGRAAGAQQ